MHSSHQVSSTTIKSQKFHTLYCTHQIYGIYEEGKTTGNSSTSYKRV